MGPLGIQFRSASGARRSSPLAHAAGFERLLADLSRRFAGVAAERVDGEIDRALEDVVEFLGTDRSTLLEVLPEHGEIAITHSWARPGIAAAKPLQAVAAFPWYHQQLIQGETLSFERLPEELPAEAAAERLYTASLPMLSHLAVPLRVGGRWTCALLTATARSHRRFSAVDAERLRTVGFILANALYRGRVEGELRRSVDELTTLKLSLQHENAHLREQIGLEGFDAILGESRGVRQMIEQARQVAPTDATVLLQGETGTGKELLARGIHACSQRRERPFVVVNCDALPSSLIESELFGHEKGAFTGAISARAGRFELADCGTLFLDEIAEIPPDSQVKLLRVLQEGQFERLGAVRTREVDVRVIAATHQDLERAMAEGRFRADLYYRLAVFPIHLPPLRERSEDIPLLAWDLIRRRQDKMGCRIGRISKPGMTALRHYSWPGNVRELANVIERALILSRGPELYLDAFLDSLEVEACPRERLEEVEREHFTNVLERCGWRIGGPSNAAEILGMHPSTLRSRLRKLGIRRPAASPGQGSPAEVTRG